MIKYNISFKIRTFIIKNLNQLNSVNYIPKKRNLPSVLDVNKKLMENEKCYYYKKLSENIVNFYNEIIYENDKIFPFKKKLNSIVLKVIISAQYKPCF